jgi:enamine deaminase RidA (YjgF/YER057c/UK114 family)
MRNHTSRARLLGTTILLAVVAIAAAGFADDQRGRAEGTDTEKRSNGQKAHPARTGPGVRAAGTGLAALNPDGMPKNPAFSWGVVATGPSRTIYVGGQNAVDASDKVVGKGDIKAQTTRALDNLEAVLAAGGARLEHVVKLDVHIVAGQPLQKAFEAYQPRAAAFRGRPPAVTMTFVAGLARPDCLIEIDAVAVVPMASP